MLKSSLGRTPKPSGRLSFCKHRGLSRSARCRRWDHHHADSRETNPEGTDTWGLVQWWPSADFEHSAFDTLQFSWYGMLPLWRKKSILLSFLCSRSSTYSFEDQFRTDDFSWSKSTFLDVAGKPNYYRSSETVHKLQFQVTRGSVKEANFQAEWEQQMLLKLREHYSQHYLSKFLHF